MERDGQGAVNGQPAGQQLRFDPERVDELRLSPGVGAERKNYQMDSTGEQALVSAMANPAMAVTIGTGNIGNPDPSTGLYPNHAYAIIGYNSANGTFQLYNSWGIDQPKSWLTWSQLVATCTEMCIVNTAEANSSPAARAAPPDAQAADLCFANLNSWDALRTPAGLSQWFTRLDG